MKIWYGYGSEHSANLVMIGQFKEEDDATKAKEIIDKISAQVNADREAGLLNRARGTDRYTDGMRALLNEIKIYSISPAEFEQFEYDVKVEVINGEVVITTDEIDVSAFLKVLFDRGARVEVYSAHHYPESEHRRGK